MAHILEPSAGLPTRWILLAALAALLLIVEDHIVAHRGTHPSKVAVGVSVVMALSAVLLPVGAAQPSDAALPDLISDPPRPSFFKELSTDDGSTRLVVTFDGYVHNIGEGALDVVGNPQVRGGMKQRVLVDGEWQNIGTPTVRYETDDGHNHFHLIEAIEYVLWNELQGSQTAVGSKIGFCLVDSERVEAIDEADYTEDGNNFCQEGNPSATELRMGISSGWRDIYDASTTLQWVDVSNVAPGRYWIGAITDPNDEIAESNEDNNALVFSERTMTVPGFAPRSQPAIAVTSTEAEITLKATAHGDVTRAIYVIERGPSGGVLDVPVGADLDDPNIRYFPEAGFEGSDEIVFSVRDAASPYPHAPPTVTLSLDVRAPRATSPVVDDGPTASPTLSPPSTFFETSAGDRFELDIATADATGAPARLYASGLPAGLVVDSESGSISGVPFEEGIFDVELIAMGGRPDQRAVQNVTWIVNPPAAPSGLAQTVDRSSPRGVTTQVRVGTSGFGLSFEARGLPPGLTIDEAAPVITGAPTEVGDFAVILVQVDSGGEVTETAFTWTIRPTTDIAFAL